MPVPDFQSFFKPLLEIAADDKEHSIQEARALIAKKFNLIETELAEVLPSGTQTKFDNRVAWAKSYFIQAKVLESPRRGYFKITQRGQELLKQGHTKIDIKILNQYPEFVEFHTATKNEKEEEEHETPETPEELLQKSYLKIRNDLANEILERIKTNSPKFFEDLVVNLMIALGYGGSRIDAGKTIGQSGDGGIDGIIKEDRLGLDTIYLQAKRWEGAVGRPEIHKFAGALLGKRAKKGVYITTSSFSPDAIAFAKDSDPKIILIDGKTLVNYMIDFNIGVTSKEKFELKKIDTDYFTEE